MEESHSSWVVIVSSPPCHNHQDWHHYHCSLLHPPPLYPMQFVHLLMWTLEDDPSRGSPSSKVIGSSTSSLRSKLANANSTLLFKPLSSENTSHIFVFPFNHSSLCLYIRWRLVCTYTTKSSNTTTNYKEKSSIEEFILEWRVHFYWGRDKRVQQSMPPTSRYIKSLVLLIKCQFHTLIHDRIQWKHCNLVDLEILKTIKSVEFWMGPKILLSPYEVQWGWNHSQTSWNN